MFVLEANKKHLGRLKYIHLMFFALPLYASGERRVEQMAYAANRCKQNDDLATFLS